MQYQTCGSRRSCGLDVFSMIFRIMKCRHAESVWVSLARVVVALSFQRVVAALLKHSNLSLRHLCTTLEAECLQSFLVSHLLCFQSLPLHSLVVRFDIQITLACIQSCLQTTLYCRDGHADSLWRCIKPLETVCMIRHAHTSQPLTYAAELRHEQAELQPC